ncbi:MAG: hypothetical protein ACLUI3_10490 [Christensenellales bacterium]
METIGKSADGALSAAGHGLIIVEVFYRASACRAWRVSRWSAWARSWRRCTSAL